MRTSRRGLKNQAPADRECATLLIEHTGRISQNGREVELSIGVLRAQELAAMKDVAGSDSYVASVIKFRIVCEVRNCRQIERAEINCAVREYLIPVHEMNEAWSVVGISSLNEHSTLRAKMVFCKTTQTESVDRTDLSHAVVACTVSTCSAG